MNDIVFFVRSSGRRQEDWLVGGLLNDGVVFLFFLSMPYLDFLTECMFLMKINYDDEE